MSIYLNPISEKKTRRSSICRNTLSILCFLCKLQIPLSLFVAVSLAAYVCGIQVFATGVVMLLDKKTRHLVAVRREKKNPFLSNPPIVKIKNPIYSRDPRSLVWQRISLSALRETFNQTEGCSAF